MKTRILVIGDLHGRDVWKDFADIKYLLKMEGNAEFDIVDLDYDYYVFLGDYCDAFDKTNEEIRTNLLEIIEFKKKYPKNVILLWGNHELHYVLTTPWTDSNKYKCSGYRPEMKFDLYEIFNKNFDFFQMSFQIDNHLFTHAGVHKGWYKYRFEKEFFKLEEYLTRMGIDYTINNLSDKLNLAFVHKMECMFDVGHRRGGLAKVGGPLWLDKGLANKMLDNYHQYVGHTAIKDVSIIRKDKNTSMTFLDVNHHKKTYFVVNLT